MDNVRHTMNQGPVGKRKKTPYKIIFKTQSDVSYLRAPGSTVWIHVPKKVRSSQPKGKHLTPRAYAGRLVGYVGQSGTIFKVFKLRKKGSTGSLTTVRDADIDEETDWELYSNPNLPMPNL